MYNYRMARKVVLSLAVIAVLTAAAAYACGRNRPRLPSDIRGALDTAVEQYEVPAMAACIVTTDGIESAVSGVRSIEPGAQRVTKDDFWHIGSNTKAMTATLAGILVEKGKLSLDDRLGETFTFPIDEGYRDVTLRELLQHRSGLPAFTAGDEFDRLRASRAGKSPRVQRLEFAMQLLGEPPAGKRGKFVYSNAGYGIAAALIEQKTGDDWEQLLREKLFTPLGIGMRTHLGWPATSKYSEQPLGHVAEGKGLRVMQPDDPYKLPAAIAPAGDICLPIGDYGKFLQLHLRGMMGLETEGFAKQPLPSAETIKLLHEPDGDYSCGWIETRSLGMHESSHDGSAGTFYCTATIDADYGFAVAVVTNGGSDSAAKAVHAVAKRLIGVMTEKHLAATD